MRALLAIILMILTLPLSAYADDENGIATDQPIPVELSLPTQTGDIISFDQMKMENGLVLFFVRSVDWCPYCQVQMIELNAQMDKFSEAGYGVAALSYDSVNDLAQFSEKNAIKFPLLSDPASEVIRAFKLLDESYEIGSRAYGVPHPAIYVIDEDKTITKKYFETDYTQRPDLDDVVNTLD